MTVLRQNPAYGQRQVPPYQLTGLQKWICQMMSQYKKEITDFTQAPHPATPLIAIEAHSKFESLLRESEFYLEYGSGCSTVFAANVVQVPKILAIESDPKWAKWIKDACLRNEEAGVEVDWVNIGPTTKWGLPLNPEANLHLFPYYSQRPWIEKKEIGKQSNSISKTGNASSLTEQIRPDLILIDGRFRIACFLQCLLHAKPGTHILFDDYVGRPVYEVVEKFCKPIAYYGHLAEFLVPEIRDLSSLIESFKIYQNVPF
jgi:hypothetical protein